MLKIIKDKAQPCHPLSHQSLNNKTAQHPRQIHKFVFLTFSAFALAVLLNSEALALTNGDFANEVSRVEAFVKGGYGRIAALMGGVFSVGLSIKNTSMMPVVITGGALFLVYMLMGWINNSFAALI